MMPENSKTERTS